MTDEQIEKALERKGNGYASDVTNLDYGEVLAYINRLKAENERLKDLSAIVKAHKYCVTPEHCPNQDEIRKETAKDILQDWYNDVVHGIGEDGEYIKEYAKKYGVEVEE